MKPRARHSRLLVLLALALAGLALAATPAAADPWEAEEFAAERGISVTEAAERLDWQRRAGALVDRADADLGAAFGGVWIDTGDGDRVKLGVAGGGEPAQAKARAAIAAEGLDGDADAVRVAHSQRFLENLSEWLTARLGRANAGGREVLGTGIRTDLNSVEISRPRNGELTSDQRGLINDARGRYGSAVSLGTHVGRPQLRAGCTYPYCSPPLRAGIRINSDFGSCTGAFIARGRGAGNLYQFTAGHCRSGNEVWRSQFQSGGTHNIGPFQNARLDSTMDAGILRIDNPGGWAPRDFILITDGPDSSFQDTYKVQGDSTSTVGQRICTTGAFYGRTDCGYVTQLGASADYGGGLVVTGLGRGDFCGIPGDSGAPMYAYNIAYGLQVAGYEECDSLYQGIRSAENAMNVDVVFE